MILYFLLGYSFLLCMESNLKVSHNTQNPLLSKQAWVLPFC